MASVDAIFRRSNMSFSAIGAILRGTDWVWTMAPSWGGRIENTVVKKKDEVERAKSFEDLLYVRTV